MSKWANPTRTRTYNIWVGMKTRCYNKRTKAYPDYGGRGITVCQRWLDSYDAFVEDMGLAPDGMCIERDDNDLGYFPSNCSWRTRAVQNANRRSCRPIEYLGRTQNLADWAREFGIDKNTLRHRVDVQGLAMRDALTNKDRRIRGQT